MASIFNINHYQPKKKRWIFIWYQCMDLYNNPRIILWSDITQSYANFWGLIRKSNATVLTSFVIISEFVNRYLRNELNKYKKKW